MTDDMRRLMIVRTAFSNPNQLSDSRELDEQKREITLRWPEQTRRAIVAVRTEHINSIKRDSLNFHSLTVVREADKEKVLMAAQAADAAMKGIANARRAGIEIDAEAVEHLVRAVGPDLAHLGMEVEKLAAACGDARPVTAAEVAQMVGVNRGETVEDWVDAVSSRDVLRALALTDVVLPQAGVTAVRMLIALGTELVGLRLARALAGGGLAGPRLERGLLDQLRRARPMGVRNWETQARSWASAARNWTADELDQAIRATYEADRALKSTTVSDDRATLRSLLLTLGAGRAAA